MSRSTLIIGAEPRIVVPIARSLNKQNVRVTVAAFGEVVRRLRSFAINQFVVLPNPDVEPERFLAILTGLIRTEESDFLIPCSDSALLATSRFYYKLNELLRVGCPPPHIIERVLDKRITLKIAESCGVPIPVTFHVCGLEELEAVRHKLIFPLVCKPPSKQTGNAYKARYFHSYDELRNSLTPAGPFGKEVLLQQYCEGEAVGIDVLIHNGEPIVLFQHRRIRELPSTGGVSVVAVSEPLDAGLAELAVNLLRRLEWEGIAMVEFKYDRASRTAALMEVNGRYWGSVAVAIHAGVNLPLYHWQLEHGEKPCTPANYRIGVRMRWMAGDLQRLHELLTESKSGKDPCNSRWRMLYDFVVDFRPSTQDMLLSLTDPLPGLLELGRVVRQFAVGDFKWLLKKILPRKLSHYILVYRKLGGSTSRTYLKLQALRAVGIRKGRLTQIKSRVSSVLFVCHGNIIRSPLAAELLIQQLSTLDRNTIRVCSAGLQARRGNCADERACLVAKEFGLSLDNHRAEVLTASALERADIVFVMDYLNEAQLLALWPSASFKVFLLQDETGSPEIVDPYSGNLADVRRCGKILKARISRLAPLLVQSGRSAMGVRR